MSNTTKRRPLTEAQIDAVMEAAVPLFAEAVAKGMHAPFALNVESWGRDYASRLADRLETRREQQGVTT